MPVPDLEETTNPVRRDCQRVMSRAETVSVNEDALAELTADLASEYSFEMASWDAMVYPLMGEHDVETVIDFLMVGNALNYCFNDPDTGEKYTTTYDGAELRGAFSMWGALKEAFDHGSPVTSGSWLTSLTLQDVERIFNIPATNDTGIPMLSTRLHQLQDVGRLMLETGGTFRGLFTNGPIELYGDDGVVSMLDRTTAFRDRAHPHGFAPVRFDKRSQLAVSMVYGKLYGSDYQFTILDMGEFTVFPDYAIPANLRSHGVLEYTDELARRIDEKREVPRNSAAEVELRAATVVAGDMIRQRLDDHHGVKANIPQLDYVLWQLPKAADAPSHNTTTTAY